MVHHPQIEEPMGKAEIEQKIAKRKAREAKEGITYYTGLLAITWALVIPTSFYLLFEVHELMIQPISVNEKMKLLFSQYTGAMLTCLISFYMIRYFNRGAGI